jgi:3-oxoacyl-[acyl-carrier protein] reductase
MSAETGIKGKVALVTGGSRGIGRAICLKLAEEGAKVAVNYSSSAGKAEEVVELIKSKGGEAIAIGFDVADDEKAKEGVSTVLEQLGGLEILVNNAGIASDGLLLRTKSEDWQRTIDVNLSSCFYLSKAAAKPMMKARFGRIINLSSVIGEMGNAGQVAYAASKSGIFGLTKSIARELGSRAITVNAITPGFIETDMTAEMGEERIEAMLSQIPLGRLGNVDDIASLVAFLAQPNAGYITGQVIGVNGGMYM